MAYAGVMPQVLCGSKAELMKTLEWARGIRSDPAQTTTALLLAEQLIILVEKQIDIEDVRQAQIDKFFGVTELQAYC